MSNLSKRNFNDEIPPEILAHISSYLPNEWLVHRLVCKYWSDMSIYYYLKLKMVSTRFVSLSDMEKFCNSQIVLQICKCSFNNVNTEMLKTIFNCKLFTKLEKLYLSGDFSLKVLEKLIISPNSIIKQLKKFEIDLPNIKSRIKLNKVYKKCAKQTNNPIFNYLIYLYNKDITFLEKSAELNYFPAIKKMKKLNKNSSEMKEKWLLKGAELGNSKYQHKLARHYRLNEEFKKATDWYFKSAGNGNCLAQYWIGIYYYSGEYYEKDLKLGLEWLLKSAKQNYCFAQYGVAYMYCVGVGTLPNMEESLKWLIKSYLNDHKLTCVGRSIVEFLQYFELLNHLPSEISNLIPNMKQKYGNNFDIFKIESTKTCKICDQTCSGFYQSTVDGYDSFDICDDCCDSSNLENEFKTEIGERSLFTTHFLANFIPLIEFCKERNHNINCSQQFEIIISSLKACVIESY
ncbi:TPR repeat domain-containing protein [Naegleria gruberi]|uniref:TPR repeat domain-containing protein n=1 Tax=Naegleria gruberi TaxID=5762 RepID=D2V8K2_NAEGR|nr:TPR repeat domain-containing protein [Naegleria gruberi]EFC46821.1 TPR repeat domain-containing protein [Naegleria gruberi]|eukprot:XP_002679565.1 TPR repeat domain-containing protein [Naegleria gruberi strain NEG-M]